MATAEWIPTSIDESVVQEIAKWLVDTQPVVYTGRTSTRSNVKPKALWVAFYKVTEVWWFEKYRFSVAPGTDAGAKGPAWTLFRNNLPEALRIYRSRYTGKPLDEIEYVAYIWCAKTR